MQIEVLNNLIASIKEFNIDESIYWAHLLKQEQKREQQQQQQQQQINLSILNELFKGFDMRNEELSMILSNLIWEFLKNEDFPIIYEKFHNEIFEGLKRGKDENVLKLCLKIIFELGIKNFHEIDENLIKESLKLLLITSNYSISSYLMNIISNLPNHHHPIISNELLNLSSNDPVIKFRLFELLSKTKNYNNFKFFEDIKLILLKSKEDPLMTLNIIQIIQDCITKKEEFQIFSSEGIIELLLNLIENENSIISCKILDFFANCSILKCFDFEFIESKALDRKILEISEQSEIIKVSAIFCLATFAILSKNPQNILKLFENYLFHEISSVQLSALNGIGVYYNDVRSNSNSNRDSNSTSNSNSDSNRDSTSNSISDSNSISTSNRDITVTTTTTLSSTTTVTTSPQFEFLLFLHSKGFFNWLIEKINSNFIEEKSSAYFTLKSIISIKENFIFILDNSTIFSILLQRNLDDSSIGLKWKYGILEEIYLNSNLFDCLNDPLKDQVKKYLNQGVTFIPKTSRVTFEAE